MIKYNNVKDKNKIYVKYWIIDSAKIALGQNLHNGKLCKKIIIIIK